MQFVDYKEKEEIEQKMGPDLSKYLKLKRKEEKLLEEDYLRFDSMIESGNIERVEAYPLNKLSFAAKFGTKQAHGTTSI